MFNNFKDIFPPGVTFRRGEFKNDSTMVEKLPEELKQKILQYMRSGQVGIIGDVPLIDPMTGICYTRTNVLRNNDGFEWSDAAIYMFEHYDVRLSDEFLALFQ